MKTRIISGLLVVFLMSFMTSCDTKSNEKEVVVIDIEQIKQEIQEKENEFADVYNSGETKKIGYYADDAVTFSYHNEPIVGKPAIIEFLKSALDSVSINNKISFETKEVFPSNDGLQVVEIGYYKVINMDSVIVNSGNYMVLFVKRDGKYVSLRDMSTSDM